MFNPKSVAVPHHMDAYQQLPPTNYETFDETPSVALSILLGFVVVIVLLALAFFLVAQSLSRGLVEIR